MYWASVKLDNKVQILEPVSCKSIKACSFIAAILSKADKLLCRKPCKG